MREPEGTTRVWHAKRENTRGVMTFRRVIWQQNWVFPSCDCKNHISAGVPCVHILLVLLNEGMPLFDSRMFHTHWKRQTTVRVAPPLANDPFHLFSLCSEERQTQDQPVHHDTSPATTDPVQALEISPSDSYNMQPNTPNSDVGSPTPNLARPCDKASTGKLMSITRSLIDYVTRPAAKKKGLDQKLYDTLKRIRSQLQASQGDDGHNPLVDFETIDSSTTKALFIPGPTRSIESVSETPSCGGAPQVVRKKKRHDPEPLAHKVPNFSLVAEDSLMQQLSQVTEVAPSKARYPPKNDALCRFCGANGCNRRRCPKIRHFGVRCISGQLYLNTP